MTFSSNRLLWLLFAAAFAVVLAGCWGDAWYDLVVVNETSRTLRVFQRGSDSGQVEPCSQKTLQSTPFEPGKPQVVQIRELDGTVVLTSEQTPKTQKTTYDWQLTVSIPGSAGECPAITVLPTMTPVPIDKYLQPAK